MTKRIVLCADDFGQAEPISKAIIVLIQHGRITATSCMVNSQFWPEHGKWLRTFKGNIDIGLHFNLTEGQALSKAYIEKYGKNFSPLTKVMRRAILRQLDKKVVEEECHAQLDKFQEVLGVLPDFIDGHQHVHQFPVIRDAIVNVYNKRLQSHQPYMRWVNEKINVWNVCSDFKKILICATGTRGLKKLLNKHHIPHNQTFSGVYSFSDAEKYSKTFPKFLAEIGNEGLIMCHPGLAAPKTDDVIADARYQEYQYLFGSEFLMDCYKQGAILGRFKD